MDRNGMKQTERKKNRRKRIEINGKQVETDRNVEKQTEMDQKFTEPNKNSQKGPEMDKNGQKLIKTDRNGQIFFTNFVYVSCTTLWHKCHVQ